MSDLVVIGFDGENKADEVLRKLAVMRKENLIDLEDAAVVSRDGKGECHVRQAVNLTLAGASGGSFWGLLIGLLFLHPVLGVLAGAAAGAISGSLSDFGINDDFIEKLGKTLKNESSALFVLVRKATPDKVIEELKEYDGTVLHTSLSIKQEDALKAALEKAHQELQSASV